MNDSIRIRTDVGSQTDKFINFKLDQKFDFIEILSLKLRQEDVYRLFCSDYGVVVGRVIVNGGFGVPNAKVSIFIPIDDDDKEDDLKSGLYPYENINDKGFNGTRYNLLPKKSRFDCHTIVGNLPNKRELLDNNVMLEIYEKYYKYTTVTNQAGDFMLFGVPTGTWKINMDVDLSDIGTISQKPYDFIRQGESIKRFEHVNKFKKSNVLNDLPQIYHTETTVNVLPFWGDTDNCEVGINRLDTEISHRIEPHAFFIGSIFGDNEKNSVNKICGVREKVGNLCETVAGEGTIEMIRKTNDGAIEPFLAEGGRVIDENGAWAYQIPMNLDYFITDEFGNLIPTEDTSKGIPTRARVRFRIGMDITGSEGRLRQRAKFLVPNNPDAPSINGGTSPSDGNYDFDETTPDTEFRDLYWNKIYTVKQFIPRYQPFCAISRCGTVRRFTGIKDVDDCGSHTPFPFNRLDTNINPLFNIICIITTIIATIIAILNKTILRLLNGLLSTIATAVFNVGRIVCGLKHLTNSDKRERCRRNTCIDVGGSSCPGSCGKGKCNGLDAPLGYISVKCGEDGYMPWFVTEEDRKCGALPTKPANWCNSSERNPSIVWTSNNNYLDCVRGVLAEWLKMFKFDFYNDWVNGTLFSFLFKYKVKKKGEGKKKFCDYNCDGFANFTSYNGTDADNRCRIRTFIVDTCDGNGPKNQQASGYSSKGDLQRGLIKLYKDEFYYAAALDDGYPYFKTDLYLLGSILPCDIHGIPLIYNRLVSSTYNLQENFDQTDEDTGALSESGSLDGLYLTLSCLLGVETTEQNCWNIRKASEIGVGIDEDRSDEGGNPVDWKIGNDEIEDDVIRNTLGILNSQLYGVEDIENIGTSYSQNINTYNSQFGVNAPWNAGTDYTTYRNFRGSEPRLTDAGNSYYFYFGITNGKSGLDKFYTNFVQVCEPEVDDDLSLSVATTGVTTLGGSDGAIQITVSNGTPNYNYELTYPDGSIDQFNDENSPYTFNNLSAGTYSIYVEDDTGINGSTFAFVEGQQPLNFTLDKTNANNGDTDGTLIISNPLNGTPPYRFEIIDGPASVGDYVDGVAAGGSEILTGLVGQGIPAGTYTIEMTDSSSPQITKSKTIVVGENEAIAVGGYELIPILCFGGTGNWFIEVTGGTAPYTYGVTGLSSNNTYTDNVLENVGPEEYYFEVTDAVGATNNNTFTLTEPDELEISTSNTVDPSCYDSADGSISITVIGGTGAYEYDWTRDNSTFSDDEDLINLDASTSGTDYRVIVSDENGCEVSETFTLIAPPQIVITETLIQPSCNGDTNGEIQISVDGGVGGYSYLWSNGETTQNIDNLAAGTYSVIVTDANGCEEEETYNLGEPAELIITANSPSSSRINMTAVGGTKDYTYSLSGGPSSPPPITSSSGSESFTGLISGNYDCTVTDASGCTKTINTVTVS